MSHRSTKASTSAPWRWPLFAAGSALQAFGRDQRGTAITEFVIALPVFLILFSGMIKLANVADVAIDNKVYAADKLWQDVYAAEDDPWRMSPRSNLIRATNADNIASGLAQAYTGMKGHWGESYMNVEYLMQPATGVRVQDQQLRRKLSDQPEDFIGDATVANALVDDTLDFQDLEQMLRGQIRGVTSPSSTGTQSLVRAIIGSTLQIAGATSGYAANIRYGAVQVEHEDSMQVAGKTLRFRSQYESLVSPATEPPFNDPFSNAEDRSWVVSWMVGQMENPYFSLMNVLDQDLDRRRRYVVPSY